MDVSRNSDKSEFNNKIEDMGLKIPRKTRARALGRDLARDLANKSDKKQRESRKQLEQQFHARQQDNFINEKDNPTAKWELYQHKLEILPSILEEINLCTKIFGGLNRHKMQKEIKITKACLNKKRLESRIAKLDDEQKSVKEQLKANKEAKDTLLKDKEISKNPFTQRNKYKDLKKSKQKSINYARKQRIYY